LTSVTTDYISVGQQVDIEALAAVDASNNPILDANGLPTWSATSGLVRLTPSTGWAVQNSVGSGDVSANLISLGGFDPATLTFTGTNSVPTAYTVSTSGIDTSSLSASPLFRFDGLVTPFGMAPPDFVADSVTSAAASDQIMTVTWAGSGTTTPFVSKDANGLVVNISGGSLLGARIQTGPLYLQNPLTSIDMTTLPSNTTIIADPALKNELNIGNPTSTTGLAVFHDYSSFLTDLGTVLNGTNTVLTLVAVGRYDASSNVFTAYRIDMVQLP
jgi:hypothetical protein